MRARGWQVASLVGVLVGAFAVQATSTWRFGGDHQLADVARPGLILMLELGSVTGASIYVTARTWPTRRRAGLLVAIAAGVGCYAGVQEYHAVVAIPVTLLLLLTVEMIRSFWAEQSAAPARQLVTLTARSAVARPGAVGPSAPTEPIERPAAPATGSMDPPSLHAVPRAPGGKRNRDELEAAGRALDTFMDETGKDRIRRKTGESVDSLRARVEAAEAEDAARRRVRAYML